MAGDQSPVPNGYKGLNWNDSGLIGVIDANPYFIPGVDYTGYKDNVLFNAYGFQGPNTTVINVANGGSLDFLSGYWGAGITGDVNISFEGYVNNILTYTSGIYNLDSNGSTLITLNWFGIDSLAIASSAAVWTADSLEINVNPSAVPVPSAVLLFGSAMFGFAGFRRKSFKG